MAWWVLQIHTTHPKRGILKYWAMQYYRPPPQLPMLIIRVLRPYAPSHGSSPDHGDPNQSSWPDLFATMPLVLVALHYHSVT